MAASWSHLSTTILSIFLSLDCLKKKAKAYRGTWMCSASTLSVLRVFKRGLHFVSCVSCWNALRELPKLHELRELRKLCELHALRKLHELRKLRELRECHECWSDSKWLLDKGNFNNWVFRTSSGAPWLEELLAELTNLSLRPPWILKTSSLGDPPQWSSHSSEDVTVRVNS